MSFEEWWDSYPKKVAKQDALKAWGQLTMFDLEEIDLTYDLHCRCWRGKDVQFLPHPATWLRGRRWEDDLSQEAQRLDHEHFRVTGENRRVVKTHTEELAELFGNRATLLANREPES